MSSLTIEHNPIAHKAQIFSTKMDHSFQRESEAHIPHLLWQQYFNQFKWLYYKNDILECSICQEAYIKHPNLIECNEWTNPNKLNHIQLNINNLILILKLHNFSENHIFASELLDEKSPENSTISCLEHFEPNSTNKFVNLTIKHEKFDKTTKSMELLHNFNLKYFGEKIVKNEFSEYYIDLLDENNDFEVFAPRGNGYNPWIRYLSRYCWLYLKDDNPGCKYCEQAFKLSLQMSFTKWTSPNTLSDTVSQDRPNRTLLQHDRSKNHRIAENVLVEHKIITISPRLTLHQSKIVDLLTNDEKNESEYPTEFTKERWNRFVKNYPWLYFRGHLFHCRYCERAFENHRERMTHTSWTSSQFDSSRIKDVCKARHYFYDHQRSNNHRVATTLLENEGVISTKTTSSSLDDDNDGDEEDRMSTDYSELELLMRPMSPQEDDSCVLSDKQWRQLCCKYFWLVGDIGKCYGCKVCQLGRRADSLAVNVSQWTEGSIEFTKTKYIQLRKSLWCHSITRNHINAASVLQQSNIVNNDQTPIGTKI